jgi:hypothetical protein
MNSLDVSFHQELEGKPALLDRLNPEYLLKSDVTQSSSDEPEHAPLLTRTNITSLSLKIERSQRRSYPVITGAINPYGNVY